MKRCILFFLGAFCCLCVCNSVYGQQLRSTDRLAREAETLTAAPAVQNPYDAFDRVFWVSSPDQGSDKVKIVNSLGQEVPLPPSGDVGDLPEDVYFISLKTRHGKQIIRFVVNRW